MNLSPQQRTYARRLKPGEAIVRSRFGRPVHIPVSPVSFKGRKAVSEECNAPNAQLEEVDPAIGTDAWLAAKMQSRLSKAGLDLPPLLPISLSKPKSLASSEQVARRIYTAPKGQFCSFCQPLLDSGSCPYKQDVSELRHLDQGPELDRQVLATLTGKQPTNLSASNLSKQLSELLGLAEQQAGGAAYCLAARMVPGRCTSIRKPLTRTEFL